MYGNHPNPHWQPGYPPVPPPRRKNRLPWIIGGAALLLALAVLAAVVFIPTESGRTCCAPSPTAAADDTSAAPAPAEGVTFEITGHISAPLAVTYTGADDSISLEVSELPWSVTVSPEPEFKSIFAVHPALAGPAEITLTVKRGDEVLRSCQGGAPCIAVG